MTPPPRDEVWVCVKLTRAQCVGQDDEGATPRIADAIRAALARKGEPWATKYCDTCTVQICRRDVCRCGKQMKQGLVVPLEEEP